MTVFVLTGGINYEGNCVIAVYASREAAEAAAEEARKNHWDWVDIEESTLLG